MERLIKNLFRINVILGMIVIIMTLVMMVMKANADVSHAKKREYMPLTVHTPGKIRVMVIDTGIDFAHKFLRLHLDQNDVRNHLADYMPSNPHGTHVAGLVIYGNMDHSTDSYTNFKPKTDDAVCKQVEIISCAAMNGATDFSHSIDAEVQCLKRAIEEKVDIINYSGGSNGSADQEYEAFVELRHNKILVIAAAGNEKIDLAAKKNYFPATYAIGTDKYPALDNVIPVASINGDYTTSPFSNRAAYFPMEKGVDVMSTIPNDKFGTFSGTSQAAPIYLHKILVQKCHEMFDKSNDLKDNTENEGE